MKPDIAEKWVAALRSGDYMQGAGRLRSVAGEFCCLGVLCDLYHKENPGAGSWVNHGAGEYAWIDDLEDAPIVSILPECVRNWAGMISDTGRIRGMSPAPIPNTLAEMNDRGTPFNTIADIIDREAENL